MKAARQAGIDDEHRYLLLRQLGKRALLPGDRPSITAPALNNSEFEVFMGLMESVAPGNGLLHYKPFHFTDKARDRWKGCRRKLRAMFRQAVIRGLCFVPEGCTEDEALDRFLRARVATAAERDATVDAADWGELHALITILQAMARKHGTKLAA